ncbi:MAG: hypothetical protein ABJD11_11625 [Gemmatimonadota bacterium]
MTAAPQTADPVPLSTEGQRWTLFGVLGYLFLLAGLLDLGTIWFPLNIGNPEWEFGTVSTFLDSLPILVLGLGMVLAAGLSRGSRWQARMVSIICLIVSLLILFGLALYATNLPQAFRAMNDPAQLTILKRAVAKAGAQSLVYVLGLWWAMGAGWRRTLKRH